jgi:hypothetical protein
MSSSGLGWRFIIHSMSGPSVLIKRRVSSAAKIEKNDVAPSGVIPSEGRFDDLRLSRHRERWKYHSEQ